MVFVRDISQWGADRGYQQCTEVMGDQLSFQDQNVQESQCNCCAKSVSETQSIAEIACTYSVYSTPTRMQTDIRLNRLDDVIGFAREHAFVHVKIVRTNEYAVRRYYITYSDAMRTFPKYCSA